MAIYIQSLKTDTQISQNQSEPLTTCIYSSLLQNIEGITEEVSQVNGNKTEPFPVTKLLSSECGHVVIISKCTKINQVATRIPLSKRL